MSENSLNLHSQNILPSILIFCCFKSIVVTGRHVSAQEALKLGIVDQVTDENACKMAVEFALRAVGMSRTCRAYEVESSESGNIPEKSFSQKELMFHINVNEFQSS